MTAPAEAIDVGHVVGPYRLTRQIGQGSFAVVYQAKVQRPQSNDEAAGENSSAPSPRGISRVAIKIVTVRRLTERLRRNLRDEIDILRTVRHANIVELLDNVDTPEYIYLVMQYCRMGDLSTFIRSRRRGRSSQSGRNPPEQRVDEYEEEMDKRYPHPHDGGLHSDITRSFVTQLASALEFMHGMNIVHRDIKPQNLLLQEPEQDLILNGHAPFIPQLKVADFGFARHLEAASLAETLCGSPLYMAPEILRYEKYNAKADLWSVGAVLYEMCLGKPPFKASNHVELLRRIDKGDDKFKFPDERSEESLRREHARRVEDGRENSEFVRPHVVDDDLKSLIRKLLKRRPIERMEFADFFSSEVLMQKEKNASASTAQPVVHPSSDQSGSGSVLTSTLINGQIPIYTRIAPAIPTSAGKREDEKQPNETENDAVEVADTSIPPASPAPMAMFQRHYFTPRYVVGGLQASVKPQSNENSGTTSNVPLPTDRRKTVPANVSPSPVTTQIESNHDGDASSLEDNVLATPGSSTSHLPAGGQEKGSENASNGSTAVAQDSMRRSGAYDDDRGYVMVDKRNVDVNALAAEESANRARSKVGSTGGWSPLGVVRRPSQQLSRLASLGAISPLAGLQATSQTVRSNQTASTSPSTTKGSSPSTNSPVPASSRTVSSNVSGTPALVSQNTSSSGANTNLSSSPILSRLATTPPNAAFAVPASARKPSFSRRTSGQSEGSRLTALRPPQSPRPALNQLVPSSAPTIVGTSHGSQTVPTAVNQANGISNISPTRSTPPPLSLSQQQPSALQRAISMASIRLFGVPTGTYMRGTGVKRPLRMGVGSGALLSSSPGQAGTELANQSLSGNGGDVTEQNLLNLIRDYDKKSFVLSEFADAKLSGFFTDGPHQNNYLDRRRNSSSSLSSITSGSMSKVAAASSGAEKVETVPTPSSSTSQNEPKKALASEIAASEAYVLYVRSLSFLKRAICAGHDFIDLRSTSASRYSTSQNDVSTSHQEILEAIQWLQSKFHDGNERANFARSKSIEEMPESAQNINKIIFEEALQIAKRAALDELNEQRNVNEESNILAERNLLSYETASTLLQSLLDPAETERELPASSINTIEQFLNIIDRRVIEIQRKFGSTTSLAAM